jgi:hypothetical protein
MTLKYKVDDLQTNANKIPGIEETIEDVKKSIPTIPSDLNDEWETVKANTSNPTTSIFHQSIIDHTTTNNSNGNLFQTITNNTIFPTTIKTTISDTILLYSQELQTH